MTPLLSAKCATGMFMYYLIGTDTILVYSQGNGILAIVDYHGRVKFMFPMAEKMTFNEFEVRGKEVLKNVLHYN